MTGWPTVKLGDIAKMHYGNSLPAALRTAGVYRVYGSNGQVGLHSYATTSGPTIIVGRKGSFGEVHFSEGPCWPIDTAYYIDATTTDQDLRWLFYALQTLRLTGLNRAAAIPGLNREDAYRQKLLLPPLPEQRRITAILDQADHIRRHRSMADSTVKNLASATLRAHFGNFSNAPKCQLSDVSAISSGITVGRRIGGVALRSIPFMAVVNVQDKFLNLSTVKTIEASDAEIERYRLRKDDLLLTEGGDPDKLGRGTLWRDELPESIHQNHIFRVRPDQSVINPTFLSWAIGSAYGKAHFLRLAKQTTGIASINMSQLKQFPLPLPPLEQQVAFEKAIEAIDVVAERAQMATSTADALFASLQSRAIRGEL